MLLQFSIRNVSSFLERSTLDLVATNYSEHDYSLINAGGVNVLPVSVIYGPNASGKTRLLSALKQMVNFVCKSLDINSNGEKKTVLAEPFLFSKHAILQPSEYEIVFVVDGTEYCYGYTATIKELQTEYLLFKEPKKNAYLLLYERAYVDGKWKTKVGRSSRISDEETKLIKTWEGMLQAPSDLLLTALGRRDKKKEHVGRFGKIYEWFLNIHETPETNKRDLYLSEGNLLLELYQDEEKKNKQLQFVQKADPTICDFMLVEGERANSRYRVMTKHKILGTEEEMRPMPASLESSGTRNMIILYPEIKKALENGGIVFADELDCNIHPLLLQEIIRQFTDPEINVHGAQLICTLHNVVIMNRRNLRRDEIWFVERDLDGCSGLYSLADVEVNEKKVRNDADYCRQYILGQYGAVPHFLDECT